MAKMMCKPHLLSCPQSSDFHRNALWGAGRALSRGVAGEGDPQQTGVGEASELGCKVKGGLSPGGLVGTESYGNSPLFFQL